MRGSKAKFERRQELEKKKKNNLRQFFSERLKELETTSECNTRFAEDCLISIHFRDGHKHHLLPSEIPIEDFIDDLVALERVDRGPFLDEVEDAEGRPDVSDLPVVSPRIKQTPNAVERKPIIFKNRQAIGDILMMTCAIRDFRKAFPDWPMNISTTAMHLWDNNPHLNRELTPENAEIIEIGPSYLTNASNRDDRHFANAFRISIQDKLKISFKQGPIKPDIWMTKEEATAPPLVDPPYWIIVAGEKGDWTCKTYPFERWQTIVNDIGTAYPEMKFVQVGAREHVHPKLEGRNVIDFIGKTQDRHTGIRDLFRLYFHAEGSMGLVSFQTHLAAAFNLPCIVIAGAREPARFTRYPNQQYLCTDGCLPCAETNSCWHCSLEKACKNVVESEGRRYPRCVDIIRVRDVEAAFYQLYEGGRLSASSHRIPTLPNATASATSVPLAMVPKKVEVHSKFGLSWGGSSPTKPDWEFMHKVIKDIGAKTALEFGSGLSTLLMADMGLKVTSYEVDERWISEILSRENENIKINMWNGTEQSFQDEGNRFDFAFVDGPAGGESREWSIKIASLSSDNIIVHDAGRAPERKWQDKYLSRNFELAEKGGHRCHWWRKRNAEKMERPKERPAPPLTENIVAGHQDHPVTPVIRSGKKTLKVFCNTRGDGGCGRSINWFMDEFIKIGWDVEYVYSHSQPSGTYRRCGNPKVMATNDLVCLRAPCDVFLLATDDFVWEFKTDVVRDMFSEIQAKRKVMYINYRIGKIGKLPWTQEWDRYLFLNSELESIFRSNYMNSKSSDEMYSFSTKVLAPPTDLSSYFKIVPNYGDNFRIIRHSSQGDAKYPKDFNEKIERILEKFPNATIQLMPAPSFLDINDSRIISYKRNQPPVNEFLSLGNVFWYSLPEGYTEGGPRTILEAMASGLPVVTGNHSGPKDRVIDGKTGFLCNSFEEELDALEALSFEFNRKRMGIAARERAKTGFNPEKWIKEIIGE